MYIYFLHKLFTNFTFAFFVSSMKIIIFFFRRKLKDIYKKLLEYSKEKKYN